jgi:regulator of replication initiation timing
MDKKKMKVLKEALKEMKAKMEKLGDKNTLLTKENEKIKADLIEKETQNQEIFEENHKLHDNILVLQ